MKYVLGIDSGGTKYLVRAAGLDGTPLGCDIGPAANHYMQPYDEGDIWAREILDRAAACNFDLLSELAKKLGYAKNDRFKVGLWGSTIVKGSYQRAQLTRLMLEAYPNAEMVIASRDAAQGAVAWAIERLSSTC